MKLEDLDHKFLGRDSEAEKIEVEHVNESYIYTSHGKKYIDFVMGWCVGNFGWNNSEIKKRLQNFDGPDYVSPQFLYRPRAELAQQLELIAPGKLKKSFRATGGSEAVEIALEAAMTFTKRQKFISVDDAYHGNTIAARNIGSPPFGNWYKNPFSAQRMKVPLDLKRAEQVEQWLKNKDVAAVIMEPIVLNHGVLIPDQEFMEHLQMACKKYGTLLIMDEVATGFGRTGKKFASEHFKIEPDIMCLGKSLTGGYAPMGATMMTEEVAEGIKHKTSYYSTFGWHPLSVEAALGTIDYLNKNFSYLEVNIREIGNYIVDQIYLMEFEEEPHISMKGLAIGVKFESEDYGYRIVKKARENGLILSHGERGFKMFPALNIDRSTVEEALDILINSI